MPLKSWEKTLTCPYNPAHQITPDRMQRHLVKCRRNHADCEFVVCQYNSCHHIPKPEEQQHLQNCPDRKILELAMYREAKGEVKLNPPPVSQSMSNTIYQDGDEENWELEVATESYDPQKKCMKSNVLRKIQGATPSQRKKFYAAERIRHENLKTAAQSEEKEKEEVKVVEEEEEEEEKEIEQRQRTVRASQEPLRRPTVERRQQDALNQSSSLQGSRQGSITSRLLSMVTNNTTEPRHRPSSIINPGRFGSITEAEDSDLTTGTLNSRLGRMALSGRGRGEVIKQFLS